MKITILGSGDAFGSGGRLQTALHLAADGPEVLIDCGATTSLAMERAGVDPNRIQAIVLTHLHGDHFSGVVWFLLHAQHVAKRRTPLTIVGPRGTRARLAIAAETLFPGTSLAPTGFAVEFLEHIETAPLEIAGFTFRAFEVTHESGAPPYALRVERDGAVFAFSGDTECTDVLMDVSQQADVFICECHSFSDNPPGHISWAILEQKLPDITAKQLYLTHMDTTMLANRDRIDNPRVAFCEDGLILDIRQDVTDRMKVNETLLPGT